MADLITGDGVLPEAQGYFEDLYERAWEALDDATRFADDVAAQPWADAPPSREVFDFIHEAYGVAAGLAEDAAEACGEGWEWWMHHNDLDWPGHG